MILEITPRGMAPTLATLATGPERHTVTVTDGASIRGRLISGGKPIPNVEMLLATHSRVSGTTYQELRIGTNANGEFVITNVPPGRVWDLVPRMDSLASKGLAAPLMHVDLGALGKLTTCAWIQLTTPKSGAAGWQAIERGASILAAGA